MRFTENNYHDPSRLDFVPREYKQQFLRVIVAFTLCLIALLVIGVFDAIRQSGYSQIASLICLIFMSLYVVVLKQRDIDALMNTEYQNMLFAQGVELGASFYLYVRSDGTIAYMNNGLRKLIRHEHIGDGQHIDGLLVHAGVAQADRLRVTQSIAGGQTDRLVFPILVEGAPREFIFTIDPLRRPAGMVLIRGREYRDTRTGTQLLPDILRSTSPEKLEFMLAQSPIAQYTTDAYGKFEYVSPAFEKLLNYDHGEVLGKGLTLDHLFASLPDADAINETRLIDYSGDVKMVRNQGGFLNAMLFQSLQRDENSKIVSIVGTIVPFSLTKG